MFDCLGRASARGDLSTLLQIAASRKIRSDVTLPRLMIARQPMFRLGWFAGRDRLQRSEIDRFVQPRSVAAAPWRATRRARWRRRRAPGRAGCRRARMRPAPRAAPRRADATASSQVASRSSASAAVSAASSYSRPTQNADCATIMSARPGIGAAHLQEALDPHVGEHRGDVVGEVAHRGDGSREVVQPPGHEVAERRAGHVDICAIAIDEVHRHMIDQPFDVALEAEAGLEHHARDAGALRCRCRSRHVRDRTGSRSAGPR